MNDSTTYAPGVDYFFLGDGRIIASIQWSRNGDLSPYGILLQETERMTRKEGSRLFHPELGLARTMLTVIVGRRRFRARHDDLHVAWDLSVPGAPSVILRWHAGYVEVTERLYIEEGGIVARNVRLTPSEAMEEGETVAVEAALYANPLLHDEFGTGESGGLYAAGLGRVDLVSDPGGRAFERFLTVPYGGPSGVTFRYGVNGIGRKNFPDSKPPLPAPEPISHPDSTAPLGTRIGHQYRIARNSLRAAVSLSGKFDASIWQYNFEWGMDAAMVATAALCAGEIELGRQVLRNILTRLSNPLGMIAESGRFRGGELSELNGNGAVMAALGDYWRTTGDEEFLRAHWERITAIADYPLRPEFSHESGLLIARRDLWERTPWMGLRPGFELVHQVWCSVGLSAMADLADRFGDSDAAGRWRSAALRMTAALTDHPTLSLIEEGRFIHRRLPDGSVQGSLVPDPTYWHSDLAPYVPDAEGRPTQTGSIPADDSFSSEPDASEVLPIIYGLVDPRGDVSLRTLDALSELWNPNGLGGYARCNIASEPDSPGPWAFATAFVAGAELEAGLEERASRTITWLLDRAGAGGSWFEYYGERMTPPFPPIGVIVWGWAQFIILVVKHIVGIRVAEGRITIAPKLSGIEHEARFGPHTLRVIVHGSASARLNGVPSPIVDGGVSIPLPLSSDLVLEFTA